MFYISFLFAALIAPHSPQVMEEVRALPHSGNLEILENFVYVAVDDAYIHDLVHWIEPDGFEEPPYFGPGLVGAHITVISPEEMQKHGVRKIDEIGQTIRFTPRLCKVAHPGRWKEVEEVYFIEVESPELDQIRAKYGLPKQQYAFHITVGVKRAS